MITEQKLTKICELFPTIVTPFFDDGSIDYNSVKRLINHFAENNCDGIFAVCQSSEMFFLNDNEKLELSYFCIEECRKLSLKCVVSGHTQNTINEQIHYLKQLETLQPDAVILVLNRFAAPEESYDILLDNLKSVCEALDEHTPLGIYECPFPYHRLLTAQIIDYMVCDGRFRFIKDTSCEIDMIQERIKSIEGSPIGLYNANVQSLYQSTEAGARGFSGIMLNFIPEIFAQFKKCIGKGSSLLSEAYEIYNYLCFSSLAEIQNYPSNAKYYLQKQGHIHSTSVRNGAPMLNSSQKLVMDAFKRLNEDAYIHFENKIKLKTRY